MGAALVWLLLRYQVEGSSKGRAGLFPTDVFRFLWGVIEYLSICHLPSAFLRVCVQRHYCGLTCNLGEHTVEEQGQQSWCIRYATSPRVWQSCTFS